LLVVAFACALAPPARAAGVDWSKAQLVTVFSIEYSFEPSHLVLRRNTAYRLHLENHGRELHELTAPDFLQGGRAPQPRGRPEP
jgi:hypothetical protein